jgi:hypothetical protein
MHILIAVVIGIVILAIIISAGAKVLFGPKTNSAIHIILGILGIISIRASFKGSDAIPLYIVLSLGFVDCIRDWIRVDYYDNPSIKIDKLYMIKSFACITFMIVIIITGLNYSARVLWYFRSPAIMASSILIPRAIFLAIIYPAINVLTVFDLKGRIKTSKALPFESLYSSLKAKQYHYAKAVKKEIKKGALISNVDIVNDENKVSRAKLAKLYPEKFLAKVADMISGDKEIKAKREDGVNRLTQTSANKNYAYINAESYNKYIEKIPLALKSKGRYSPADIKSFTELKDIDLSFSGSVYFIIMALHPFVKSGIIEDLNISDEIFDNHAYWHTQSSQTMKSRDASDDEAFKLDED